MFFLQFPAIQLDVSASFQSLLSESASSGVELHRGKALCEDRKMTAMQTHHFRPTL